MLLEPVGIERLKEALEANSWEGDDLDVDIDFDNFEDEDEGEGSIGFDIDPAEMQEEMAGMKQAIYGGGNLDDEPDALDDREGEKEVEELQAMMLRMQAVRGKDFLSI